MAQAYRAYCKGKSLSPAAKMDVYRVVLMRSMMPAEQVMSNLKMKVLTREDAKQILKGYPAAPKRITVRKDAH